MSEAPTILDIKIMVLGAEVAEELAHPEHLSRTHGTSSTYNKGCRGPLCGYTRRNQQRTEATQPYIAKEVDAFLQEKLDAHHAARHEMLANRRRS